MMLGGDYARKNAQTAGGNDVIMIAFAEFHAPQFQNAQSAARTAVVGRELFHFNDAVCEAEHVRVGHHSTFVHLIVKQKNSGLEFRELLFESQKLAPVA